MSYLQKTILATQYTLTWTTQFIKEPEKVVYARKTVSLTRCIAGNADE